MARRKKIEIPQDEIALRAFLLFEKRGFEHGHDTEDWLQAEREIRQERQAERVTAALEVVSM
jgi:hypothetical protein